MMRWLFLAILIIAVTAVATVGVRFIPPPTRIGVPTFPTTPEKERTGPPAKAVVEGETSFKFGAMAQQTKGLHEWTIKNEGQGDLTLEQGNSTCSCTIANLAKGKTAVLKPGESTTVLLEWNTKAFSGEFSQSSEILTHNDPDRQKFEFIVSGKVQPALLTYPPGGVMYFASISNEKNNAGSVAVMSPDKSDLELLSVKTSRPDMMTTKVVPLTEPELEEFEVQGGSGHRIELEIKEGMPVGEIHESLVVETNHPQQPTLKLAVQGRATGPIGVMPGGLQLSAIAGDQPVSRDLYLWVRGQDHTTFEVAEAPKKLKVEITSVDEKGDGDDQEVKARRYRMTITVPAGTSPGLIEGEILLKTDHPRAHEVKIPVDITIRAHG